MTGALPPSSRCVRLSESAAPARIFWPVAMEPVSDTMRTCGCVVSCRPTGSPRPQMTLTTPGGKTSASSSASRSAVRGVCSEGLTTSVLPAASAGAIFQAAIISG